MKTPNPKWCIKLLFYQFTAAILAAAVFMIFFVNKAIWLELEMFSIFTGIILFIFYTIVLYKGVRLTDEPLRVELVDLKSAQVDAWELYPNSSTSTDFLSDFSILGLIVGLVLDIFLAAIFSLIFGFLLWIGLNLFIAGLFLIFSPLFFLFKQSLFIIMNHSRYCNGQFWHSALTAFIYAAIYTSIMCFIILATHYASTGFKKGWSKEILNWTGIS